MSERASSGEPPQEPSPIPAQRAMIRHRVVLPSSGRVIEVLEPRPLHSCPACDSNLVEPNFDGTRNGQGWPATLNCPNCEWSDGVVLTDEQLDKAVDESEAAFKSIVTDLERVSRANMQPEVERFCVALWAGHILPEDLAAPPTAYDRERYERLYNF